jgi:hypothetical protein
VFNAREKERNIVWVFEESPIQLSRDTTGRIVKWSIELGEFELESCPQQAIKFQNLADFVSEWTETQQPPPTEKLKH